MHPVLRSPEVSPLLSRSSVGNARARDIRELLAQAQDLITPELEDAFRVRAIHEKYEQIAQKIFRGQQSNTSITDTKLSGDINGLGQFGLWTRGNPNNVAGYDELCRVYQQLSELYSEALNNPTLQSTYSSTAGRGDTFRRAGVAASAHVSPRGSQPRAVIRHTRLVRSPHASYCSQDNIEASSPKTLEEGVKIVERILARVVLCRHDVEDINKTYKAMDHLDRHIVATSTSSSLDALTLIMDKVKKITLSSLISAADWISLYHLQSFVDQELQLKESFSQAKFTGSKDEVAGLLPCCISAELFHQDIDALVRPERNDKVDKVLTHKKEKLQRHEDRKTQIAAKKIELVRLREIDPQHYPAYFDELLEEGYVHLYDQLIRVKDKKNRNDRREEDKTKTFSELSHIILETRDAIFQKVAGAIPAEINEILFLLGTSGAGKSTTLCYLRGDHMELVDSKYVSKTDPDIIGHETRASCTLLPSVEIVNGLAVVDFPGFDDTNGPLISMGMEFALKALIKRYEPKVLVVESITNIEGRLAAVANLGRRLYRLVDNKEECTLGVTKYLKDDDFKDIRTIEAQQKAVLKTPTVEEVKLTADIESDEKQIARYKNNPKYSDMISELEAELREKRVKLAALLEAREQQTGEPLPETPDKTKHQNEIAKKEKDILQEVGLNNLVKFVDLRDRVQLLGCLAELSKKGRIRVKAVQMLDSSDKELLENRFKEQLIKEIETGHIDFNGDVKAFRESVLRSSLISTIFSHFAPEIGQCLHLPEIDSALVREFDKQIVGNCIKKYIITIIKELDVVSIQALIEPPQADRLRPSPAGQKILEERLARLRKYIIGLEGEKMNKGTPKEIEEAWIRIREKHQLDATKSVEKDYALPTWLKVLMGIPLGVPLIIHSMLKRGAQATLTLQLLEEEIQKSSRNLDTMYQAVTSLKDLEKIILKQDAIDALVAQTVLSLNSIEIMRSSIEQVIEKTRELYGEGEWDARIDALKRNYFIQVHPMVNGQTLLGVVCPLLDDRVVCIESTQELEEVVKAISTESEIKQEPAIEKPKRSYLQLSPTTILIRGKMNAAVFKIEAHRRMGKVLETVQTTDVEILNGIARFKEEMDMTRPLSRLLLVAVLLSLHVKQNIP
jgi:hypothetical protein